MFNTYNILLKSLLSSFTHMVAAFALHLISYLPLIFSDLILSDLSLQWLSHTYTTFLHHFTGIILSSLSFHRLHTPSFLIPHSHPSFLIPHSHPSLCVCTSSCSCMYPFVRTYRWWMYTGLCLSCGGHHCLWVLCSQRLDVHRPCTLISYQLILLESTVRVQLYHIN